MIILINKFLLRIIVLLRLVDCSLTLDLFVNSNGINWVDDLSSWTNADSNRLKSIDADLSVKWFQYIINTILYATKEETLYITIMFTFS